MKKYLVIAILFLIVFFLVGCSNRFVPPSESFVRPPESEQSQGSSAVSDHVPEQQQQNWRKEQRTGLLGQSCEGAGSSKIDTFPLDVENIELITPMGRVQDSHITPTDHQYIIPKGTASGSIVTDEPTKYEIKAPADGYIINVELFRETVEEEYRKDAYQDNYLVFFEHSCTFYTRLIHIDTLSPAILSKVTFKNPESQHPYGSARTPVKKGEVIGTVGPHSFDFQIMDMDAKNSFISPDNTEPWTLYTVDTFDYLAEPLRTELLKKNIRTTAPLGGRVNYDLDGTLQGNWYKNGRRPYDGSHWKEELSVVHDFIDDSQIRVALGNFDGYFRAFGVKGNAPKPETVTPASGMIMYELVPFEYYDQSGKMWDAIQYQQGLTAKNEELVFGVVVFQLVDATTLKMEAFPGKTANHVNGFTERAAMYKR
ncbi:hypothetical protein HYS47_00895 [Candidatus Woesearchaeota archaeon]|nr:hypothetical protein [Candidatus Woesearchaeota archaeon]